MKKALCIVLSILMVFTCVSIGFATENNKVLSFNEDGTFKIMQINDTQDVGKKVDKRMIEFIEAALDKEKPDLVVFAGDQLSDMYTNATKEDMTLAINNIIKPLADRNVPFLVTIGNHDYDHFDVMSAEEQFAAYAAFDNCYAATDGCDPFTYNVPVMSSDLDETAFNIYMMDTRGKIAVAGYAGISEEQLQWYNEKSAELKAENGGEAVPSMLFQHIPVKEVYSLLKECDYNEDGAVYAKRDKKWYALDKTKAEGILGEAPCSEEFDIITGQYQAWVENGDIMGAFFAHDHVNTYMGTTDDGIVLGYNGGTGFRSYGNADQRTVRIFEFNENDVENYTTRILTYAEATGKNIFVVPSDLLTPALLTRLMKVVYFFFGWLIKLAK